MSTEGKSTTELERLRKFVGRWNTEGKIPATESTPQIKISGTDTYEWLPGEFFLLHKVDVSVGDYDNKGSSGYMTATCKNGVWTFLGDTLKFTGGFGKEDNEVSGIWEQTTDGENWTHLMDIKLTKQR